MHQVLSASSSNTTSVMNPFAKYITNFFIVRTKLDQLTQFFVGVGPHAV